MKILFSILLCVLTLEVRAQYPTVTSSLSYSRTISSHGLSVGEWLTVDDNGDIVTGTDPSTQPFIGIVSKVVSANVFEYAPPGGPITLSGLTAGEIYYAQTDGTLEPSSTATDTSKPVLKAISTTQAILYSGSFGAADLPPPTQGTGISVTATTSNSATMTVSPGTGTGRLFVVSETPLDGYPVNNNLYTADPNFQDGDALGSDGHVVENGDLLTVDITGLDPATVYYFYCFEYTQDGAQITYNTGIGNSTSTNTLADATTPTEKYVVTNVKSKQTSIEISGSGCSCDAIVVVANDSIPVSVDISDGTDPSFGPYGSGTNLTERNYVVFEGSPDDFSITGLSRDRKIYYKIYERENTGFLYNTLSEVDSAYTAFIYDNVFTEGTGDPPGQVYLEASAKIYYDFSDLTFADESNITNGDAGLVDQGPNSFTATIQGTPVTNDITFNSASRKSARSTSTNALNTGTDGTSILVDAGGFEVIIALQVTDGILASGNHAFSGVEFNSWGYNVNALSTGHLQMRYVSPAGSSTITTSSVQLTDGVNDGVVLRFKYDFTNDVFSIYKNGTALTVSSVSGVAISSHTNTSWNPTRNIYVGNRYTGGGSGVPPSNTGENSIARFAITPIMTAQEAIDVTDWFAFTALAGTAFDKWDVVETDAYDQETITDSLHLSGSAAGFDNYLTHVDILPDSLQEWEMSASFRISGALTTNPSGLGLLIRNDEAEPNHSVMGQINLDTDADTFGKLQIFSGDGTVDFDAVVFRGASSGEFVPAEDSVYRISLKSDLQNNDVLYSLQILDYYDSLVLNAAFTAPNRPLSDYYGTTTKVGFWFQGPDFMIGEFALVRTGTEIDDTDPPPTPTTYDFRVDLVNGVDTNPCTDAAPCLTIPVGMSALSASGGSNKSIGLSAGTHILTTNLVLPTNLGLMEGAGSGLTFIEGTANLDRVFWSPLYASSASMLQALSSSTITTSNSLKGFTIRGGVAGNRDKAVGLFVRNRDGFDLEDVDFRYFNSAGLVIEGADVTVLNCDFVDAGGSGGNQDPATGYPVGSTIGSYATGAITIGGTIASFDWTGGSVSSIPFGAGYGLKCLSTTSTLDFDNFHIDGVSFDMHPLTAGSTGGNFAIELHTGLDNASSVWGELEIENCYFRNCAISLGVHQGAVGSSTHTIHDNEWDMNVSNANWCLEVDASNLEIYNNYFHSSGGAKLWAYARYHNLRISNDHHYHNNIYEVGSSSSSHRYLLNAGGVMNDILIENETINFTASTGAKWEFWTVQQSSQSGTYPPTASDNVVIQDIAFYGDNPGNSNFWAIGGGPGFTNSILRNCFATHLNVLQTQTGVTNSNNQTNLDGSAWFNFTGPKWDYTSAGYYFPKTGSALRDAGNGSDDVGASQH